MNAKALAFLLLLPAAATAQGYAGLGTDATGFMPVTGPADLDFPRDHAPHPLDVHDLRRFRADQYEVAAARAPDGHVREHGA